MGMNGRQLTELECLIRPFDPCTMISAPLGVSDQSCSDTRLITSQEDGIEAVLQATSSRSLADQNRISKRSASAPNESGELVAVNHSKWQSG